MQILSRGTWHLEPPSPVEATLGQKHKGQVVPGPAPFHAQSCSPQALEQRGCISPAHPVRSQQVSQADDAGPPPCRAPSCPGSRPCRSPPAPSPGVWAALICEAVTSVRAGDLGLRPKVGWGWGRVTDEGGGPVGAGGGGGGVREHSAGLGPGPSPPGASAHGSSSPRPLSGGHTCRDHGRDSGHIRAGRSLSSTSVSSPLIPQMRKLRPPKRGGLARVTELVRPHQDFNVSGFLQRGLL